MIKIKRLFLLALVILIGCQSSKTTPQLTQTPWVITATPISMPTNISTQESNTGGLQGTIPNANGVTVILCNKMKMGIKAGFNSIPAECIGDFEFRSIVTEDKFLFTNIPTGSYILYFEIPSNLPNQADLFLCPLAKGTYYYLDWEIDDFIRYVCYDSETFAENFVEIEKGKTTQYSINF